MRQSGFARRAVFDVKRACQYKFFLFDSCNVLFAGQREFD